MQVFCDVAHASQEIMIRCRRLTLLILLSFAIFVAWFKFVSEDTLPVLGWKNCEVRSNNGETIMLPMVNRRPGGISKPPEAKIFNNYNSDQQVTQRHTEQKEDATYMLHPQNVSARLPSIHLSKEEREEKGFPETAPFNGNAIVPQSKNDSTEISHKISNEILNSTFGNAASTNKSVLRVIEFTYLRAGSSFLGDILQSGNKNTFYYYEPLAGSGPERTDEFQLRESLEFLSSEFRCNFSHRYIHPYADFTVTNNKIMWTKCRRNITSCFDPKLLSTVCKEAEIQVMKLTRLSMNDLQKFLKENEDLNIKVVFLVRDPRGIMSSRKLIEWCTKTKCGDVKTLCDEMTQDVEAFDRMHSERPDRFIKVIYERLALNAKAEVKCLYKALGMPFTPLARDFLRRNTQLHPGEIYDPYSTKRNSPDNAFKWRHRLGFKEVKIIQKYCSALIDTLGYVNLETKEDVYNATIPVLRISTKAPETCS